MSVKFTDLEKGLMRETAREAARLVRSLSHEDRLLLLCQLTKGERSVSELEEELEIRQPSLSQQLGVLRNEGLVSTRREGKRIYYSLADENARAVLTTLCGIYCQQVRA